MRTLPLYLHGASPEDLAAIKARKAEMNLDFLVKPIQARPGQGGRVLSFAGMPGFVCDWSEGLEGLSWAMGLAGKPDGTYADWLTATLGGWVTEIEEE